MDNHKQNLNTPIVRLPRTIDRAVKVFDGHRGRDPILDAHGASMVEAAERFQGTTTALNQREAQLTERKLVLDAAMRAVQHAKAGCLVAVTRQLPSFDTTGLVSTGVWEDERAQGRELYDRVAARLAEGATLHQGEQLLAILAASLLEADEAALAAAEADTLAQEARDERFVAAAQLDDRLIEFRSAVRSVLGATHRDYRKLRARNGRGELGEDLELDEAGEGGAEQPEAITVDGETEPEGLEPTG